MDEKKILIVAIYRDQQEFNQYANIFSKISFYAPRQNSTVEVRLVLKSSSFSTVCNQVRQATDAKFLFFITSPVAMIHPVLISKIMGGFFLSPNFGVLGLLGSEIPISGDYTQAKKIYGNYFWADESGKISRRMENLPFYFQNVHTLDSGFFATAGDIPFDEKIGDDFFLAAHCCSYRRAGYDVGVVHMEVPLIAFAKYNCIYEKKIDFYYAQQLNNFRKNYFDIVTPLVSICIPTYNQPRFCEVALRSALGQTYPNIEVIVGDDSTNDETKRMIQPYLQRYTNLKYFHHGGPLGDKGGKNTTFVLNKSSGEYINVLFHDDVLASEKISRMMQYYLEDLDDNIGLVTSARIEIDENGNTIKRKNPLQPLGDIVLSGEKVGRTIVFTGQNYIGELSTVLLKRKDLLTEDPLTGKKIVDVGTFCGVKDLAFGDVGTWLNVLKTGKNCVFIKDLLSAFRRHSAQNTYDKFMKLRLKSEFINYFTISYLNEVYIHSWEEYKLGVTRLKGTSPDSFGDYPDKDEPDAEKIVHAINFLREAYSFINAEKFEEVLDCSIRFLLNILAGNNAIRPLVHRNSRTGLWEKASDGIMLHGNQRY